MTFNSIRWNWSDIFHSFSLWALSLKISERGKCLKKIKIFDFSFLYVIRAICFARSYFAWYYIFKILFFSIYDIIILWTNQMPLLRYLAILVLLFEFSVYFIFIDLCIFVSFLFGICWILIFSTFLYLILCLFIFALSLKNFESYEMLKKNVSLSVDFVFVRAIVFVSLLYEFCW